MRLASIRSTRNARRGRIHWTGAISFEERCTASLERVLGDGGALARVTAFEYETVVFQGAEDRARRRASRRELDSLVSLGRMGRQVESVSVDPYSYTSGYECLDSISSLLEPDDIWIVDISCMTKVHAMALGCLLAHAPNSHTVIAYTVPAEYSVASEEWSLGWRDIIIGPLFNGASMGYEGFGRGVILAGHEVGRLAVALSEVEPSQGAIVFAAQGDRPDLLTLAERRNARILERLLAPPNEWSRHIYKVEHTAALGALMERETVRCHADAPMVLFPFGPKPFVVAAAGALVGANPTRSWFVYPIPVALDVNYSDGIGDTYWYSGA